MQGKDFGKRVKAGLLFSHPRCSETSGTWDIPWCRLSIFPNTRQPVEPRMWDREAMPGVTRCAAQQGRILIFGMNLWRQYRVFMRKGNSVRIRTKTVVNLITVSQSRHKLSRLCWFSLVITANLFYFVFCTSILACLKNEQFVHEFIKIRVLRDLLRSRKFNF